MTATPRYRITCNVDFTIDEEQARALELLTQYAPKAIVDALARAVGDQAMKEHGQGLRRFLQNVESSVRPAIRNTTDARKLLKSRDEERARRSRESGASA